MIGGHVAPGFELVRELFAANFAGPEAYRETGASLAAYRRGECIVDLWGGYADRTTRQPWRRDTLVNVWSTTKGIAAIAVATLVERGLLRYEDRVSEHWPEFAAVGKGDVTVAEMLSHQAGLPGFSSPIEIEDMYQQSECAARLAAQAPLWQPGTANGYHAATWGVLVAELVRRIDGRSIGRVLAEDIAGPANADFFIGLSEVAESRIAPILPPDVAVDLAALDLNPAMQLALGSPQLDPLRANDPAWRAAELPAMNGHGSAQGIARIYSALISGQLVSLRALAAMTSVAADRTDLVLGFNPSWAMGVMVNHSRSLGPLPLTFGHGGWGGSVGCAEIESGIAIGYTPSHMGPDLVGDPRMTGLCNAIFECARSASQAA